VQVAKHVVEDTVAGFRLDRYIAERLGILSRSQLKVRKLCARVNGKSVKLSRLVSDGDLLELEWEEPEASFLIPQKIPLEILYEDSRVVVLNKRQGMVVHPGAGNKSGTLANALLYRRLSRSNGDGHVPEGFGPEGFRPGIVHRLDKDTSGVIIAAWDDEALAFLAAQFKERSTRKTYLALTKGVPPNKSGTISTRLTRDPRDRKRFVCSDMNGKQALSWYKVLETYGDYALVALRPKTGRTHQLRVHLKQLGCPILGDPIYGRKDQMFPEATLMLHAYLLTIELLDGKGARTFKSPVPARFRQVLLRLRQSARWSS